MKFSTISVICFLTLPSLKSTSGGYMTANVPPTSGYTKEPLYASRSFDFFHLLPTRRDTMETLSSRISKLESTISATIANQLASLDNRLFTQELKSLPFLNKMLQLNNNSFSLATDLKKLKAQVTKSQPLNGTLSTEQTQLVNSLIKKKIDELESPKCPAAIVANGGKVIGSKCYTLSSTAKTYLDAQQGCKADGGFLAEPKPIAKVDNQKFYNEIKNTFNFSSTESIYVGLKRGSETIGFSFGSNDADIPSKDQTNVFEQTGGQGTQNHANPATSDEGALLQPSGIYLNVVQTAEHRFICQFHAF